MMIKAMVYGVSGMIPIFTKLMVLKQILMFRKVLPSHRILTQNMSLKPENFRNNTIFFCKKFLVGLKVWGGRIVLKIYYIW
jgi:hypothetical protein